MNAAQHTMPAEACIAFELGGERLFGVLHHAVPGNRCGELGVLIVVGGPQYRVGSHRQFVLLARALAAAGHPVFRFDVRGMGDSSGALQGFEAGLPDVGAAVDALFEAVPTLRQVVLWGLCDGASLALMYWHQRRDPRVQGLCLANPWLRTEAGQARTTLRHYYVRRVLQPGFWRKLLTGRVAASAIGEFRNLHRAARAGSDSGPAETYQERMLSAMQQFPGPMLLLLSGRDFTAKEFLERCATDRRWRAAVADADLTRIDLPRADHTFSDPEAQHEVERCTTQWLDSRFAGSRLRRAVSEPAPQQG